MAQQQDDLPEIAEDALSLLEIVKSQRQPLFFTTMLEEDEEELYKQLDKFVRDSCKEGENYGLYVPENTAIQDLTPEALMTTDITQVYNARRGTVLGFGIDIGMMLNIFRLTRAANDPRVIRQYILEKSMENKLNVMMNTRLYILIPMLEDTKLRIWTRYRRFRCMDAMNWLAPHPMPFSLDLFGRLIWPDEYLNFENDELDRVLYKYTDEARLVYANIFIRLILFVCGTVSFLDATDAQYMFHGRHFPGQDGAAAFLRRVKDNIEIYSSPRWNSPNMPAQDFIDPNDLQSMMAFVSERMKFCMEAACQESESRNHFLDILETQQWIRAEHMSGIVLDTVIAVITDYFAMYFCAVSSFVSIDEFVNMFAPTLHATIRVFMGYMLIEGDEEGLGFVGLNKRGLGWEENKTELNHQRVILENRCAMYSTNNMPFPGIEMVLNNELLRPQWGYFRGRNHRFFLSNFRDEHIVETTEEDIWESMLPQECFDTERAPYLPHTEEEVQEAMTNDHSIVHDFPTIMKKTITDDDGVETTTLHRGNELFGPIRTLQLKMYVPQFPATEDHLRPKWISIKRKHDNEHPWQFGGISSFEEVYGTDNIDDIIAGRITGQMPLEPLAPAIQSREDEELPRRELVNYTAFLEDYQDDIQDSDNEHEGYLPEDRHRDNNYLFLNNADDIEAFYKEILGWAVNPDETGVRGHINSSNRSNGYWLRDFFKGPGKFIVNNVSHCPDLKTYTAHMMALVMLTVRANVIEALHGDMFLPITNNPNQFMADLHDPEARENIGIDLLEMDITGVSCTKDLIHFSASSENEELNRDMIDTCLMGLTLCLVQVERGTGTRPCPIPRKSKRRSADKTGLMFGLIRRVAVRHLETGEDIDLHVDEAAIEQLEVRMTMNRTELKKEGFALEVGHRITFIPVCSIASEFRILKALPRLQLIPDWFRQRMFGNDFIKVPYNQTELRQPPSNNILTEAMTIGEFPDTPDAVRNMIEAQTDQGCRNYLVNCVNNPDLQVHESHFNSLIQVARVLGDAHPGSSGMAMIRGPPGTGKTTTIIHAIGAALHHSEYGHMVPEEMQVTHVRTDHTDPCSMRRRNNPDCLKILVVASSNTAVDNIMERIHNDGIPDGHGGAIRPKMMRIARHNYNPPAPLGQYLVRHKAALYDEDHETRSNPTLQAKRTCANETILFFSTVNSAGSSQLKELNQTFDIVFHDEAAFTLEWDLLVTLTAACTHRDLGSNRLFYFAIGDDKQLSALNFVSNMVTKAGCLKDLPFDINLAQRSLFERLILARRCTHTFLSAQFRMHPSISRITSPPFYNHYFDCPVPVAQFLTRYNQPEVYNDGFYPMTILDTAYLAEQRRHEQNEGNGRIRNRCESDIIIQLVDTLFDLAGDAVNN